MWICEICNLQIRSKSALLNHKSTVHEVVGQYQCKVCDKYFHINDEYKKHVRVHTGEKPYKCNIEGCDKAFAIIGNRKIHLLSHNSERNIACVQCSDMFKSENHLKRHKRNLHDGKHKQPCPDCGKVLANSGNLKIHRRLHTGEKPFTCTECLKAFADLSACKRHEATHKNIEERSDFKCKQCNETFKSHLNVWKHTQREHVKDIKKCDICDYTTIMTQNLKEHIERKHVIQQQENCEMIQCPDCKKSIKKTSFSNHKRDVHTNANAFECELCQKRFSTKSNLITHQLFHKGLRQFPCSGCEKIFFTNRSKKVHFESIHLMINNERIWKCQKCEFTSSTQRLLVDHEQQIHDAVGKYPCNVCTYQATCFSGLKRHKLVHMGRKSHPGLLQ